MRSGYRRWLRALQVLLLWCVVSWAHATVTLTPVYRFYNHGTAAHFYTVSLAERDQVMANLPMYQYEGAAFQASTTADASLSPVHRFFNVRTGVHFYTISDEERQRVQSTLPDFRYEGVAYHAGTSPGANRAPLYRFYLASKGFHFYSASATEVANIRANLPQYVYEGVAYYLPATEVITGLNYPSNRTSYDDLRFKFTGASLIDPYPATYLWRVNLRHQNGYYTTFFWGPDGGFTAQAYYGAHPYPDGGGSETTTHKWEVSIEGGDDVVDLNGHSTVVNYGAWHTQALVVRRVNTDEIESSFYWNLPDTSKVIRHTTLYSDYANSFGSRPYTGMALSFGDAPWSIANERLSGILRGIQIYSTTLSVADILAEASAPLSTTAGAANIWYLNLNPTPADIADKSGKGHHPAWATMARPALWTGP